MDDYRSAESTFKFSLQLIKSRLPQLLDGAQIDRIPVEHARIAAGDIKDIRAGNELQWSSLRVGDEWGEPNRTYIIDVPVRVPANWESGRIALRVRLSDYLHGSGPEALAYLDGRPLHGIDLHHTDIPFDGRIGPGEERSILLETFSSLRPTPNVVRALELIMIDPETEALYHDVRTLLGALNTMPDDSVPRVRIARALDRAYRSLDLRDLGSVAFRQSAHAAREGLTHLWGHEADPNQPTTQAVGHAHIDLAWLWPVSQTRRKGARTFSTVLRQMERYPDYRFVQSQPALYEMVREDEPELYAEILGRIRDGRWVPTGASWVEMDCNLPGGESLIRQFMLGKKYYREELGVDSRVLWLPDVFGYSAALPQVLRGCEVEYFMTTKISWNEYNRLPYDTFRWRGIDGSEVLSHMPTAPIDPPEDGTPVPPFSTYNAMLTPYDIAGNWTAYRQKAVNQDLLYLFGYGDGGGGPTTEMHETAERLRTLPGFTSVHPGNAETFFQELEARVWNDPDLPTWVGELYFEYHRGTYTSQAWIKRANRQAESLLREAELWTAFAGMITDGEFPQRQTELHEAWKTLLFNQFHDILPGSSITPVYEDARRDFAEITERTDRVRQSALEGMTGNGPESLVVWNPAPFSREDPVEVTLPAGRWSEGAEIQEIGEEPERRVLVAMRHKPLAVRALTLRDGNPSGEAPGEGFRFSKRRLENKFFRIELDEHGEIRSLFDKHAGREVIASHARGNALVAFEDRPLHWDAWDIQIDYQDKPYPIRDLQELRVVETGPLRGGVEIVRHYRGSTIWTRMLMYRDIPRIDFVTEVDWHERQTLLKVAFPVLVNSDHATFDIQWGNVERPTHWNTSWDWARFETCAHKWVDLSEGEYGVSLLNDCKYGHDIHHNVMRLTLIKSPIDPDPEADQGRHVFTYSLLPHEGDWRTGETVRHAYMLNMPMHAQVAPAHSDMYWSLFSTDRPGLVIETVKPAENGDGIIVRLYDAHNSRGEAIVKSGWSIESAEEVNMLERSVGPASVEAGQLRFTVRPYGIHSFRVRLRRTDVQGNDSNVLFFPRNR